MRYRLLCAALMLTGCASTGATPTTSTPSTTPPTSTVPSTTSTTIAPTTSTTPTTSLPELPDLSGHLAWFAPLPPLPTGPSRPFIGSADFMQLFTPDADWEDAVGHLQVFKLYGEWVLDASESQLAVAVADIRRRGLRLAVEMGPLDTDEGCGSAIEGFAGTDASVRLADRIERAGGTLDVIALDEPFYYGSIFDGPNACHWSAEKVAGEVGDYIELMRSRFPNVVVGDIEPTPEPVQASTLEHWLTTFKEVNGYDLAFLHLDIDWTRSEWPAMVDTLVKQGESAGVPIGMIYIGNAQDPSDQVDIEVMGERVLRLEDEAGVHPDQVIFQSWVNHPDHVLPESEPYTFTWFIDAYFEDRSLLGFTDDGSNIALNKAVTASRSEAASGPEFAVDGDPGTHWSAGDFPTQWIQIDLGEPIDVARIELIVAQYPDGDTTHRILGSPAGSTSFVELGVLTGSTHDGQLLVLENDGSWSAVDAIRVETTKSPSWVAWAEIQVRPRS